MSTFWHTCHVLMLRTRQSKRTVIFNLNSELPRGLLEVLSQRAGCIFLSDLHTERAHHALAHLLPQIDAAQFSTAEWNEAVQYILSRDVQLDTPDDAKDYLTSALLE